MSKINLEEENKKLKKENENLKKLLKVAKVWMEREVKTNVIKIAKSKLSKLTEETKDNFFWNNVGDIITKKISDFFWEIMLLNVPSSVIDNIISAEINYYHLRQNPISDGLSVISSFHKSMDILIEQNITKWYRKFCKKKWYDILRKNEPIEKALNSVVNKWYILSIWRLYHLIKLIKTEEETYYDYVKAFKEYLNKYTYLKEILLDDEFYKKLWKLIASDTLWWKRHKWRISFVETGESRSLIIWDFENKDCIIYRLAEV